MKRLYHIYTASDGRQYTSIGDLSTDVDQCRQLLAYAEQFSGVLDPEYFRDTLGESEPALQRLTAHQPSPLRGAFSVRRRNGAYHLRLDGHGRLR